MKKMSFEGCYVQIKDILSIQSIYGIFPTNLMDKVFPDDFNKKQFNINEFVFINDSIDVKMINSFDWILDYEKLYSCSLGELHEMMMSKNERLTELHAMLRSNPNDKNSEDYIFKIRSIEYEIQEIKEAVLEKERYMFLGEKEDLKR